jgi:hypothetical protein
MLPPCRLTVVYVRTISPRPALSTYGTSVHLVLQKLVALAQRDLALEVEHDHVPYVSFLDLHENAPDVCAVVSLTHPVREAAKAASAHGTDKYL